jgi:golgi phosphoprotein 3
MSSGLTRRRGGGGAANGDNEDGDTNRVSTPTPKAGPSRDSAPETSYESNENGHKIAFDPRDMSESAERSKQPKLTLMEEVLLLGLKDKQVRGAMISFQLALSNISWHHRATYPSGTTIYLTLFVGA